MTLNKGCYVYCTEYRHYKTGMIIKAPDYGRTAWKFWVTQKNRIL